MDYQVSSLRNFAHAVIGLHQAIAKASDPNEFCGAMWECTAYTWATLAATTAKSLAPSLKDTV